MATAELLTNIEKGNIHKCISDECYQENISPIYKTLESLELSEKFIPEKHLAFKDEDVEKTRRVTMKELGLDDPRRISEVGVSDPFPLFTDEAIEIMRLELLRDEVFRKYARLSHSSTSGIDCVIRGYARECCPFTYAAWTHPKTVAAVSAMAGVELQVIMDYEVAHSNIAMKSHEQAENEKRILKRKQSMADSFDDDIPAIVGWHNDSYPFVCVLMLSDTTDLVGGETLLKKSSGEIIGAENPSKGKATVLQGRLINHILPFPAGFAERITAVTSYIAKDPMKEEGSVLGTVKPEVNFGSRYNDFYPEWIDYRMRLVSQRCQIIKDKYNKARQNGETFKKDECMQQLKDLELYVGKTWREMQVSDEEYLKSF